jgi:hypothetical protein
LQWTNSGSTSDWVLNKKSFISFNGDYSSAFEDDEKALKKALKERGGYIRVGDTDYFGFKYGGSTYFATIDSFGEGSGIGEHPLIKKNKGFYKATSVTTAGFDTGGYTGEWGPEGRMAMLHQKEIVLNAHDTENFLTAIGIVRDISDQIEKNAIIMQYQNQLANYRASVGNGGDILQ